MLKKPKTMIEKVSLKTRDQLPKHLFTMKVLTNVLGSEDLPKEPNKNCSDEESSNFENNEFEAPF